MMNTKGWMKNKFMFLIVLALLLIASLSYIAQASFLYTPTDGGGLLWMTNNTIETQRIYSFANRSGIIVLNVSFGGLPDNDSNDTNPVAAYQSYFARGNTTHFQHITNVTFHFLNVTAVSSGASPGPGASLGYHFNSTVFNITVNQSGTNLTGGNLTFSNTSFNTALLPDGVYSINVSFRNSTFSSANPGHFNISNASQVLSDNSLGGRANNNGGFIFNLTIDNTPPTVTNGTFIIAEGTNAVGANSSRSSATGSGTEFNLTSVNISLKLALRDDKQFIPTASIQFATFSLDNASAPFGAVCGGSCGGGQSQNFSGTNQSGNWTVVLNFSMLSAGNHTARVTFFDYANNTNQSTVSFMVNTAPNVTIMNSTKSGNPTGLGGANFSASAPNITFNVSLTNGTLFGVLAVVYNVTMAFDNASGNDFNISSNANNGVRLENATDNSADGLRVAYFWTRINPATLAEGLHRVTIYANSTTTNGNRTIGFNNTESITFRVDRTAPTVSVACGGPYASGETVTCTCTASDGNSGVRTKGFGGGSAEETVTASGSGTKSSSTCSGSDFADNTATATGSYEVTTSGGGGAGGAGGGSSSGAAGQFGKTVWTSIYPGETASVKVQNGVLGVTEVSFSVPEIVYGAWVQVNHKENFPISVEAFSGKVYKNFEIVKGPALTDNKLKDAKIAFKVEKAWLAENKLPKESLALFHYNNGAWTQLATQVGQEDEAYVHYSAETPGFSYFVIGEKVGAPAPTVEQAPAAEAPAVEAPTAPPASELKKLSATGWVVALLAAVVIIAAVVTYLKRRR